MREDTYAWWDGGSESESEDDEDEDEDEDESRDGSWFGVSVGRRLGCATTCQRLLCLKPTLPGFFGPSFCCCCCFCEDGGRASRCSM